MMAWLVNFVKNKKWLNAILAMVAVYGGYLLVEAAKFDYFDKNPNMLAVLGVVVGLLTKFYNEQINLEDVKNLSDEAIEKAVQEAFVRANKE